MKIVQGAQYYVPFKFKQGDSYFTPQTCNDVKIRFGDRTATYSDGDITWDAVNSYWKYWLDQEQSLGLKYGGVALKIQAEIKVGDNVFPTELITSAVEKNIIREVFE